MGRFSKNAWLWLGVMLMGVVLGCRQAPPPTTSAVPPTPLQLPSPQVIPPTFTPAPLERPSSSDALPATGAAQPPPAASATDIPLDQVAISLRYRIPAVQLDRRLEANVAGRITVTDETSGATISRNNQTTVLVQLQQALSDLELAPVPADCMRCVQVEYALPLADRAVSGWLEDPILLASIENYMAVMLGAHFPPDALAGLRRSASPYAPAQTAVLMPAGQLWIWQSTDAEIPEPTPVDAAWETAVADLQTVELETQYLAPCTGVPLETLLLLRAEGSARTVITCPEYSLPSSLLPLYTRFDAAMQAVIENALPRPPAGFPLTALLDWQRLDGSRLTLYADGTAVAAAADASVVTETLAVSDVISLTNDLIAADVVQLGLTTFDIETDAADEAATPTPAAPTARLLVRGAGGVYDGAWPDAGQVAALTPVNALLDRLLGVVPTATVPASASPAPTATPTADE